MDSAHHVFRQETKSGSGNAKVSSAKDIGTDKRKNIVSVKKGKAFGKCVLIMKIISVCGR